MKPTRAQALFLAGAASAVLAIVSISIRMLQSQAVPPEPPLGFRIIRPPFEISALADAGDVILAGGRDGLFTLDRDGTLLEGAPEDLSFRYIRALIAEKDGSLWIGHLHGLTHRSESGTRHWTEADGLPDPRVNALLREEGDRLWIGTWNGVCILEDGDLRPWEGTEQLLTPMVKVMFRDSRGGLWFGSTISPEGGLSLFHRGEWHRFTMKEGLPHNNVNAVFEDREGVVWVGTGFMDRGGAAAFVFSDGSWRMERVLTREDGLAGEKVRSIFQDSNGVYYYGSEYDGVIRDVGDGDSMLLTEHNGLSSNEVKVFLEDGESVLWLGTKYGLTRIAPEAMPSQPGVTATTEDGQP